MIGKLLGASLIALGMTAGAAAGELRVSGESFEPTASPPVTRLSSSDIVLTEKERDRVWSFSFGDSSPFKAEIMVRVENTGDGYKSYPLVFDLFYDADGTTTLAGAMVNDKAAEGSVLRFVKAARTPSTGVARLVLLNQRGRRIWTERPAANGRRPRRPTDRCHGGIPAVADHAKACRSPPPSGR